jgi:transcriptional regulator with XRE-family HTH domain
MQFSEKIKKIRQDHNLSQEDLANKLMISRTAISKWENDRGYPSIDVLKTISEIFNISIDDLLSSKQVVDIAVSDKKEQTNKMIKLIYAFLDIVQIVFIILPLYSFTHNNFVYSVSLLSESDLSLYNRNLFTILFILLFVLGIIELILVKKVANKTKMNILSIILEIIIVLISVLTRQVYISVFSFIILLIKSYLLFYNFYKAEKTIK